MADASVTRIDTLFTEMVPDPDRPSHLPDGEAEMHVATFCDGPLEGGVWSVSVGAWDEEDAEAEVMVILEGRVRLTGVNGTAIEATAGDLLHVPQGWSGRWDVLEPLRKVWVMGGSA